MNETILYAVRSDLEGIEDATLYAEFTDKEAAIEYAKAHLDALPYVERLTAASSDDFGNFKDVYKLETVWVYSDAPELSEALDDPKAEFTRKEVKGLYGQKPNRSIMTNTLYANNTGVSNIDDLKYEDLSTDVIASDKIFQLDFPEYKKTTRGPELVTDEDEEEEITFTAEEAVPYLIDDEKEAISSYQKAANVVEESDIAKKKEILDLIKRIQEEEEEHLTDLSELIDEEDAETLTEDVTDLVPFDGGLTASGSDALDPDFITGPYGSDNDLALSTSKKPDIEGTFTDITDTTEPLFHDAEFDDGAGVMGGEEISDGDVFMDKLSDAGASLKGGLSDLGNSAVSAGGNIAGSLVNAGSNVVSAVGGIVGDIGGVSATKAKLKNARLETEIEREHTAAANQSIKTNRAKTSAEWKKVGAARAKAAAARTAAKSRLEVANIDAQTVKAIAKQAPSVANAQAELETAKLQKQAQAMNAKTAKAIAQTTDDAIKSRSDRIAARNQRVAQWHNAAAAKSIAQTADDVISATSDKLAAAQTHTAALYKNNTERVNANTAKQVAKQAPEVGKAYSKKFAADQDNRAAMYKNHEERVKANTTKYTAMQDPKVKKALADLETDKVHKQDTQVKIATNNKVAAGERDKARSDRSIQRIRLGTSQSKNEYDQRQSPKALDIKKDIHNTKLQKKLAAAELDLKNYEKKHDLKPAGEMHEGILPKRTKEYFRMLVNDYKPTPIFTEKMVSSEGFKNPFTLKKYFVVFNGQGYEVDAQSADSDAPEAVAYFQTYDEFWDYLREVMSQKGVSPEYNYIFTEGLHESMIVTDAVSLQKAAVPTVAKAEFEAMLRKNGAVQVYHENPVTFGADNLTYYITVTPTGEYELISEDSAGRLDAEQMFENYVVLHAYLTKINKDPWLYTPDIILKAF
jgi:hypothetical protein